MLLYLLRHAIAEDRAESDSARELTPKGLDQARSIAIKFSQRSPQVDRVICSPYTRAQQTAASMMPIFPELDLTLDAGIAPDGDVYGVMDAIEGYDLQQVLLVSHNPFLSNLLSVLVDGTMETHRPEDNATLHCVSIDVVAPGCGEILYTLEP